MAAGQQGGGAAPEITPERLALWIEEAQPGSRLVYHRGVFAGDASPALRDRLQAEAARGMIYLVQQRRRGFDARQLAGLDYLAVRSSRPSAGAARGRARGPSPLSAQAAAEMARLSGRRA